jgi:hypothetical protein
MLPPPRRIGSRWVLTLAELASLVYGRFARRLPGFAQSSPEYLWRNVLDVDAWVDASATDVLFACARPPLQAMLSFTGMTRGLAAGHDADGRPVLVFTRS